MALIPPEPKSNVHPQSFQGASPGFEAGPWRARIENKNNNKYNEKAAAALISPLSANPAALYWLSRAGHCPALGKEFGFHFAALGALPPTEKEIPGQLYASSTHVLELLSEHPISNCLDSLGESTGAGWCFCSHLPARLLHAGQLFSADGKQELSANRCLLYLETAGSLAAVPTPHPPSIPQAMLVKHACRGLLRAKPGGMWQHCCR